MADDQNTLCTGFLRNGGRIIVVTQESSMRKIIANAITELGMSSAIQFNTDDMLTDSIRKSFIESLNGSSDLLGVFDFTTKSSPSYLLLLDELREVFGSNLRFLALVDKSYEGLVSLLCTRGARSVLIKPVLPGDLKARIATMLQSPVGIDALVAAGRERLAAGLAQEAVAIAKRFLQHDIATHHALLYCGDILTEVRELRRAGNCYLRALKAEPHSFQALSALARLCRMRGRIRGELFWLKKFYQINNLDYNNLYRIADTCLRLGRLDEGRTWLDRTLQVTRKLMTADFVSDMTFALATTCADRNALNLAKDLVSVVLRDGNVGKDLLGQIALFRMNRLQDLDGACDIFRLLAVREKRRMNSMDLEFWSSALYNAALCHHGAHKDERIHKGKIGVRRACDDILEILEVLPDFGKNDPQINANLIKIATNQLQPNHVLDKLLRDQKRL